MSWASTRRPYRRSAMGEWLPDDPRAGASECWRGLLMATAVFFHAHPDDEALSTGGASSTDLFAALDADPIS